MAGRNRCPVRAPGGWLGFRPIDRGPGDRTASAARTPERAAQGATQLIDVTVHEGTSLSVSVSPDGRTLAMDLQGSLWTLPSTGGAARRITGLFDDARQPAWSPDGKWIAYFAYRDGGYDLWEIAPDGSHPHKLTWGPFDDREPAWSHDGTRIAFSSDRREWASRATGDYNIWVLDTLTGTIRQLTTEPGEDYMPSWSPDDSEIAYILQRGGSAEVWAVNVADGAQRKVSHSPDRADAPSWGPGGQIVYYTSAPGRSRFELDGKALSGRRERLPFPALLGLSNRFLLHVGRQNSQALTIRRPGPYSGVHRHAAGSPGSLRARRARLLFHDAPPGSRHRPAGYLTRWNESRLRRAERHLRDANRHQCGPWGKSFTTSYGGAGLRVPQGAVKRYGLIGAGGPAPGQRKADQHHQRSSVRHRPRLVARRVELAYSSDRGGGLLQIWIRDMMTGKSRQLTHMDTQPQGAAWSPDGRRIAVFNVTGMWRVAELSVIDVATGAVTKVHDTLPQPGAPAWSPDGKRLAIAGSAPYSTRFREGTNQILTMPAAVPGEDRWFTPIPHLGIDSRGGCGPVWSPDGTKMAAIYEGVLAVWPVAPDGEPLGPPRRITTELANSPSWQGDLKHILYLNAAKLKVVDIETNATRELPVNLNYTPDVPRGAYLLHVSTLVDGKSRTARRDVDILIEGNRIRSVSPHSAPLHAGRRVIDGSGLTAMPGLIEYHSHLQPDFGEAQGRAWLAFGVTCVRSPGGVPYEAVEERESSDAGLRPGPRVFDTGYLMEYRRVYYKMGIAISTPAHLELELQRAKALHYDLLKSYVRMTDLQQNRIVQFGHSLGIPVSGHELYPAAFEGMDGSEHTSGTSRRGYSPKVGPQQRSYADVSSIMGKAGMVWCPTVPAIGTARLLRDNPAIRRDPRFRLYPQWIRRRVASRDGISSDISDSPAGIAAAQASASDGGALRMISDVHRAGGKVAAGTDQPNGFCLHGELMAYVMAGMTPYEALRAATVTPAEALGLDAGSIEPGKLADIVLVDGNPLRNIADTLNVRLYDRQRPRLPPARSAEGRPSECWEFTWRHFGSRTMSSKGTRSEPGRAEVALMILRPCGYFLIGCLATLHSLDHACRDPWIWPYPGPRRTDIPRQFDRIAGRRRRGRRLVGSRGAQTVFLWRRSAVRRRTAGRVLRAGCTVGVAAVHRRFPDSGHGAGRAGKQYQLSDTGSERAPPRQITERSARHVQPGRDDLALPYQTGPRSGDKLARAASGSGLRLAGVRRGLPGVPRLPKGCGIRARSAPGGRPPRRSHIASRKRAVRHALRRRLHLQRRGYVDAGLGEGVSQASGHAAGVLHRHDLAILPGSDGRPIWLRLPVRAAGLGEDTAPLRPRHVGGLSSGDIHRQPGLDRRRSVPERTVSFGTLSDRPGLRRAALPHDNRYRRCNPGDRHDAGSSLPPWWTGVIGGASSLSLRLRLNALMLLPLIAIAVALLRHEQKRPSAIEKEGG